MNLNHSGRKSVRNSRRDRATAVSISLRRQKVAELLQTTGMNSNQIGAALGVDDATVRHDVAVLKTQAVDFLYDLCKGDLCFFYRQTILDLDHARHECWKIYNTDEGDKRVTMRDRLQALRTIIQADQARFELLERGESVLSVKALTDEVRELKAVIKPIEQTNR